MNQVLLPLRLTVEWIDSLPSSIALRESIYLHSWITVAHVVSMAVFAGLIIFMDVRLIGAGHMETAFSQIRRRLFPWQMAAFALSAATGLALFYAQPLRYYPSIYFWLKLTTIGVAGLNALAFEYVSASSIPQWDESDRPPAGARVAGALSICLWAAVILEGRMIPYANTWFPQE
jgi:hypothetical protein